MSDSEQVDAFCASLETKNIPFAISRVEQNIHKVDLVASMLRCAEALLEPSDYKSFSGRLDRRLAGSDLQTSVIRDARIILEKEAQKEKDLAERRTMASGVSTTFQAEVEKKPEPKLEAKVEPVSTPSVMFLTPSTLSNNTSTGATAIAPSVAPKEVHEVTDIEAPRLDVGRIKNVTGTQLTPGVKKLEIAGAPGVETKGPAVGSIAPMHALPSISTPSVESAIRGSDNIKLPALQGWPECRISSPTSVVPGRPDVASECDVAKVVNDLIANGKKRILNRDGVYMLVAIDPVVPAAATITADNKSPLTATNITASPVPVYQLQLTSNSQLPSSIMVGAEGTPGPTGAPGLPSTVSLVEVIINKCAAIMLNEPITAMPTSLAKEVLTLSEPDDIMRVLSLIKSRSSNVYDVVIARATEQIMRNDIVEEATQRRLCNLAKAIQKLR